MRKIKNVKNNSEAKEQSPPSAQIKNRTDNAFLNFYNSRRARLDSQRDNQTDRQTYSEARQLVRH